MEAQEKSVNQDEQVRQSVCTQAADELYNILACYCMLVEQFFKPLMPVMQGEYETSIVFSNLHEDIMKLCQKLFFRSNQVNKSILILVRVDSQVDDKDLRKKCKIMKNYTTLDFGIDPDFSLMKTSSNNG